MEIVHFRIFRRYISVVENMAAQKKQEAADPAAESQSGQSRISINGNESFLIPFKRVRASEASMFIIPGYVVLKLTTNVALRITKKHVLWAAEGKANANDVIREHLEAHGVYQYDTAAQDEDQLVI